MTVLETHQYGADPQQYVTVTVPSSGASPTGGWPSVIMINAAGFSAVSTDAGGLNINSASMANMGTVVFQVAYRGDSDTTTTVPGIPAFPMEIDDVVSGAQWVLANANRWGGNTSMVHLIAGSAGGSLAALATAELLDLGVDVRSCQLLSSNTDWYSAITYYMDVAANPQNHPEMTTSTASNHMGNIAACYGVPSNTNISNAAVGSLQWHVDLNGSAWTTAGIARATGTNLWTESYFQQYSAAARCGRKASRCWWHLYNSSAEEIPLQQPFYLMESLVNVGTMASVTIIPGATHGWALWNPPAPIGTALYRFILETSQH